MKSKEWKTILIPKEFPISKIITNKTKKHQLKANKNLII